jgi:RPM1-interacting protein 4
MVVGLKTGMQQQNKAQVPKFGNWDNAGNVPYTLYFENARKGKGGKMINPNDPAENTEAYSSSVAAPSPNAGRPPTPSPPPRHERRPSDAPPMSPNPYAGPSPYHRHAAGGRGGAGRTGGSVEQSPVHPYSYSSGKAGDYSESGGYGLVANSVERSRGKSGSRGNETVSSLCSLIHAIRYELSTVHAIAVRYI